MLQPIVCLVERKSTSTFIEQPNVHDIAPFTTVFFGIVVYHYKRHVFKIRNVDENDYFVHPRRAPQSNNRGINCSSKCVNVDPNSSGGGGGGGGSFDDALRRRFGLELPAEEPDCERQSMPELGQWH